MEREFREWLESLPDEEIESFEATALEEGLAWVEETCDVLAETCFEDFCTGNGNNPREWADEAVEMISTTCKRLDEAIEVVQCVVTRTLERLGVELAIS
jgi:hypothetical protein